MFKMFGINFLSTTGAMFKIIFTTDVKSCPVVGYNLDELQEAFCK